jgi:hypothetical protein
MQPSASRSGSRLRRETTVVGNKTARDLSKNTKPVLEAATICPWEGLLFSRSLAALNSGRME